MEKQQFKRNVAYKLKIGSIIGGKPIMDMDKLKALEIEGKEVVRVNLIANLVEKYIQEGEKKFGSITLDDATGQIKIKVFGDDITKIKDLNEGETLMVIGILRSWNNETYIMPEIIKKKEPNFLLLRKLEVESTQPKQFDKAQIMVLKDKLISLIKNSDKDGGIEIDKIIMELKEHPEAINQEIQKLLEEGSIYEPRPGKIRYLG